MRDQDPDVPEENDPDLQDGRTWIAPTKENPLVIPISRTSGVFRMMAAASIREDGFYLCMWRPKDSAIELPTKVVTDVEYAR